MGFAANIVRQQQQQLGKIILIPVMFHNIAIIQAQGFLGVG